MRRDKRDNTIAKIVYCSGVMREENARRRKENVKIEKRNAKKIQLVDSGKLQSTILEPKLRMFRSPFVFAYRMANKYLCGYLGNMVKEMKQAGLSIPWKVQKA